ncbi:MAG: HAD family phosphatase [Dysgonamonadaceae bacterium]|jgi:HAD superfamily hydrolase (TIGR01509 family)|nr:HAD family phosphatase [Dysgonamonadaceae bacterium]
MKNSSAFLFDLDGVIIDTEPQYDVFWKKTGEDYQLGIKNFEQQVKGITLPNIIALYFSHLPEEKQKEVEAANHSFDLQMNIIPIPGVLAFLAELKKAGIKMGLVTSSDNEKLAVVFRKLPIKEYFDTIVSSDRITQGKPHPQCYLLAANDLGVLPENCFVFEDSFNGIKSANAAGMWVIGLSTTNPPESIQNECIKVIPDFQRLSVSSFLEKKDSEWL